MQLPLRSIAMVALLSVVLPLPRWYTDEGSLVREALAMLWLPSLAREALMHPLCFSLLVYYLVLRLAYFVVGYPVRFFLLRFGLHVSSFSGSSVGGLTIKLRMQDKAEVVVHVDELGIDVRTMRRLRMRLRAQWMGLRRRFWASSAEHSPEAEAAAVDTHSAQAAATASVPPSSSLPLADGASGRASSESCPQGTPLGVGADNNNNRDGALSKRLELYARGVRIQLFAAPPPGAEDGTGGDSLWMFEGAGGDRGPTAQAAPTGGPGDASVGGQVLDREAQELAARLAKKISAILRTYAYMASLFAQWVDISVVDISLMVARSGELARNGRGITVNVSQATMWAESARESRGASAGPSWTPTEIRNSLHGILDWLLGVLNLRRADQDMDAGETSDESASHERLHRLARVQRRRRSHKYLSTLALEATGIRLFAGIEGAQQHMNSRWELVKLLVMQDMLASQPGGDSARPHHRGPVVNCQRCVVRNDVITTFWGLPKKVDQSIEFGQTHVRAGVVESLLDEIAILRLDPGARSAGHSARGLNGLTGRLATVLDERMGERSGEPGSDAGAGGCDGQGEDSGSSEGDTAAGIAEARRQVNRMLFLLHEVLSQLRLEHVGLALRVSELVVDLPLTPNEGALVVPAPAMLRWRQRSVDLEAGYMWSSISSTLGSAVNASRLSAEDRGAGDSMQRPWHDGPSDAFAFAFGDQSPRRPKDSTAFVRVALGTAQAIALRTPSMTSDPRAEELQPDTPGFRMGRCTLYSEMSAFLSEDLSQMPSPQPTVFVDVGRPELLLDLTTQLAFDQAGQWAECIGRRLRTIHQILSIVQPSGAQPDAGDTGGAINHHLHALVDLVLSDVKAQVTVERALWAVLPKVPPVSEVAERIALRMHHCECHLIWSLAGRRRGPSLMPAVKFRMTSSPIAARWENQEPGAPHRELLQVKRGIRAQGSIDLCLGPVLGERPRANVDASIEVGEVLGMLREHEFKTWLAMQPLWLVSRLTHAARSVFKQSGAQPGVSEPSGSHAVPPLEMRRRKLTATAAVQFDHVWVTVMASDSDEDARSGIEHGMQISLSRGTAAVRANGGSAESPHPFGLREDAAPITLNVECQRAQMFLLSAVPVGAARSETKQYSDIPAAFSREALCGWLPDMIQEHVVLVCPRLNLSRHKLEPHRARLIVDLEAASITGVNSVDSVYRWAVVMHHINYWRRRNKLARHMATLSETPRLPDDMLVSISSELADLQGDLASPVFFDVGRGFTLDKSRASTQPPQLKLKVPQLRLTIERTKHGTDSDLLITARGPIATLYGSSTPKGQTVRVGMQPLLCLDACKATFRFLRKDKRQKLGAEQGVRANSTHNKIDIAFSRGAMAFGHRYNMAETIDGYSLMQKGCKRIARKSMATCHPPLPFAESALKQRPTPRQVLAALGDPRTFTPPALRAQCTHKPAQPPKLSKPDDIPTIDLHGPELTIMVHDDPLETALSQIYQVGLREQRERLSRLEAFDAKAREIRQARARTAAQQSASGKARMRPQAAGRRHARAAAGGNRRTRNRLPSDMRMSRGANTRGSTEQLRTTPPANPRLGAMRAQTFVTAQSRHSLEQSAGVPDSGDLLGMHAMASASMQDVTSYVPERRAAQRVRTTSAAADSPYQSSPSLAAAASDTDAQYSSDADADDDGGAGAVEAEIGAAFQRLMRVESSEWIKAIRKRMVPPQGDGPERQVAGMDFSEIFDMPAAASPGYREHLCGSSSARPPYNYSPASWTHPPVPLSRLVMAPAWITLDTPLPLLEFAQVESYLRHLDPATPRQLEWSTLTPMRLRIKGGDVRMQLRDFPFPVFCVPDPYSQKVAPASYDELSGGVEVSGSLIVAERMAHERSLRSVYIPIGPRSRDSDIDLPDVGWHMAKSLQFPRLFAALSIMMFSAPADEGDSIQLRLPPLPIMSSWGTCYQPVISALMQCLESATSKSADVSPSLPWWDKVRSRLHLKCRMSVIEATPLEKERDADAASERGQMFCLALDGRDPYQVTKRPGSYLFTMRGGVRLCVNEGIPSKELCDVQSGRGIYSVPTEDDAPVASATLSELMQLRCDEFLMGVPIVVDRKVALQRLAGPGPDLGGECVLSPGEALKPPAETARAASERRQSMELLRNISADSGTRYTFVTRDLDQLYYKVLLHLSGGVRMGIGLSPYIPPGGAGLRHNHWEVHPIAPESARAMSLLGITDAYSGYRSTRLHASVSLLCPFTSTEEATPRPFAELYLTRTEGSALRLRDPDERVQQKSPGQWAAYDIDGLVSPMHSLFADTQELPDQFFTPFARASGEPSVRPTQASPMEQRSCTLPQCQISASAAVLHGIMAYLSHYVSRMMLPVRKGSLYPFTETSDNKVVKCMRSMRLVLDLKNVELAYSQRDYEIKELETRELEILDCVDQGLSPTPSDVSGQGPATSAKAEGTVRQLKARVDSFSFNLLLEQSLVKIRVGAQGVGDAVLADDDMTRGQRARRRSRSADRVLSPPPQRRPGGPPNNVEEATALRWGVGDGSLEIDYLDVRLVQSTFLLPLFASTAGLLGRCQPVNGLHFRCGSLDGISQMDQSWISCASVRDLNELDLSGAEFSSPSVTCVLWSPRLVYFTQRPELHQVDGRLDDILDAGNVLSGLMPSAADATHNPFAASPARTGAYPPDLRNPATDPAVASLINNPLLQRSLSVQRARAMSDLLDPSQLGRVGTGESTGSEADSSRPAVHRRNTSMPWAADAHGRLPSQLNIPGQAAQHGPHTAGAGASPLPDPGDARTPVSAMSYKSSFHLLEIARTRQRRLTASTARQSVGRALSPVQSLRRVGSEHDLADMQRQTSFQMDPSAGQAARMAPTGPDPKVIMRDSRSTQASLLQKRKQMLGDAIRLEQTALAQLSKEFERAPGKHNEYFRERMLQHAEHIYELSARRKLINRCMAVLGVSVDSEPACAETRDQEDVDYDRDTQEVEKVLASLYRHRCLIYSGYLIWTTQVRDKLMRFLYIQDCLTAVEYYMSESATSVVRKATTLRDSTGGKEASAPAAPPAESESKADRTADKPEAA
ncbi:Protein SABRE, partial [Coemansia biformis]